MSRGYFPGMAYATEFFIWMKDFLFPQVCLGCGKMGKTVCEVCLSNISETTNQLCPGCGKESGSTGKTCIRCWLVDFPLEGLLFGQIYLHTGIFGKLIRGLKYDHCLDAIPYLGDLMVRCIHNGYFNKDVMLIPIPLTRKRLWVRGFNQAELLADYVASTTGLALYSKMLIRRDNHNHSQTLACDRVRRFEQI